MLGFYSIRKLIEASKVDDKISRMSVNLRIYPSTGKKVTRINWIAYWELYDLANPNTTKLAIVLLCHQMIHSYVFAIQFSEQKEFESILVSSDRDKNRQAYSVSANEIINIFELVGRNYPNEIKMEFNEKKNDYDIASFTT